MSAASCSCCFSAIVASHVACSSSTLAMTAASSSCTACSLACSSCSLAIDSASTCFFGSTTLATSSYTFIARHPHAERLGGERDALDRSRAKTRGRRSSLMIFLTTLGGMLSLS